MKKSDKQTFIQIPYATFIEMIRYKAERNGIQVIDREESYTSKSSFLDHDPIPTFGEENHPNFSGYRSSRAFYRIKGSKVLIHADVNGALNIVRKYVKDAFEGLERKQFLQAPKKINIIRNAKLKASARCSSGTCGSPRKDNAAFKAYSFETPNFSYGDTHNPTV